MIHKNKFAFSLIEILVGILIISTIMLAGFQALSAVGIGKIKIIEQARIEEEAYFAAEKFFEMIKKGGSIDYEEYWNRYSFNTNYGSGHFVEASGFGNYGKDGVLGTDVYGENLYYCLSNSGNMGTGGCLTSKNISFDGTSLNEDYFGEPQRYGQYEQQFIDRNSDNDTDNGDENADGNILGDDDDFFIGIGPKTFSGSQVGELYLINTQGNERTFFRWNVSLDPNAPSGASCSGTQIMTGSGCLGTIEFLKLRGEDYGYNHDNTQGDGDNDGVIDTWLIHPDFLPNTTEVIAGSNTNSYWQNIFPDTIHVSSLRFFVYPNKNIEYSWRDTQPAIQVAPYVQIEMTLEPSWKEKRKIRGNSPQTTIATTIQLSDLDFR